MLSVLVCKAASPWKLQGKIYHPKKTAKIKAGAMCFRICNVFYTYTSQFVIFHLFSLFSSSRLVVISGLIVKDLEALVKWTRGC